MSQGCQDVKKNCFNRCNLVPKLTCSQYWLLFAVIFSASFLLYIRYNDMEKTKFDRQNLFRNDPTWNTQHEYKSFDEKFTIKTEGCSIPGLKPLNEAIKQYIFYPQVKPCRNSTFPLLDNNRTHIWIKENNRKHYTGNISDNIVCCYQSFYRPTSVEDVTSIRVDDRVKYNECVEFSKDIKVNDEFVKVECQNDNRVIYTQFFPFTPRKIYLEQDMEEISKNMSVYNVLLLGIDGVSRLNFNRTMPKTLKFLLNKGAVELLGYNKVGDNTFPNVIPMLMGMKDIELGKTCLPSSWSSFDNCPFIWNWFRDAGFFTAFGEDTSKLGTFNYIRTGFIGTPTDYYLHTFINEAENNVGNNNDFNSFLCMNEKRFYDVLLNYIEDLVETLKFTKLFGFFWEVTMTHDYLNYPMLMDTSYKKFLTKLDNSRYLDETILLLVSDHGLRWGEMRSTKQGRLEERLPFVYILVPESFRKKYSEAYKNLKSNSQRLTTPYDIHATLNDLINLDDINDAQVQARKLEPYGESRSISLFLPIPSNRTCEMADIDDHWCTCQKSRKISLEDEEIVNATSQLLKYLNKLLSSYPRCASLRLAEIVEALEVEVGTPSNNEVGWREFMVVIRTEPGDATFEATLRYDDRGWSVVGTVSRLNLYGDQSWCISNNQIKLYCFCI